MEVLQADPADLFACRRKAGGGGGGKEGRGGGVCERVITRGVAR